MADSTSRPPDGSAAHPPVSPATSGASTDADGASGPEEVPLGGRTPTGDAQTRATTAGRTTIPLLWALREDATVCALLDAADEFVAAQGFTEHGQRHANLVGHIAFNVMTHLGHEGRTAELAAAAGYLHDIGNVITRASHGQTGALLAWQILQRLDVPMSDVAHVMAAIGNHEEQHGEAVSPVAAAVIVADKSDVHRSRVRAAASIAEDIHDRVNYAVESSFLRVDPNARTLTLELTIDTSVSQVLEYFEIFLERMIMCRRAAQVLGCDFRITINDTPVL
jgi:metal-dependent HD superfamily phosphatase/phosphodiesterase